jgi:uncharacterized membrane protein
MDWVTFQGTGFENRVSGGVCTSFGAFALVAATVRSLTIKVSHKEGGDTFINSKHRGVSIYIYIITIVTIVRLKYIELVNSITFVLHTLGRALLILSGYLITQCGYTYSVRLVQLLCRSLTYSLAI